MAKTSQAAGLHRASLTKLHDLDAALELMYYGWRGMTLTADEYLATLGLSKSGLYPDGSRKAHKKGKKGKKGKGKAFGHSHGHAGHGR